MPGKWRKTDETPRTPARKLPRRPRRGRPLQIVPRAPARAARGPHARRGRRQGRGAPWRSPSSSIGPPQAPLGGRGDHALRARPAHEAHSRGRGGPPRPRRAAAKRPRARSSRCSRALGPDDLLLVLVSGGGSSLLSLPVEGVSDGGPEGRHRAAARERRADPGHEHGAQAPVAHPGRPPRGGDARAGAGARGLRRDRRRSDAHRLGPVHAGSHDVRRRGRDPRALRRAARRASIAAHLERGARGEVARDAQARRSGASRAPRTA